MTDFIATIAPGLASNWQICKRESLWGVVGRGNKLAHQRFGDEWW